MVAELPTHSGATRRRRRSPSGRQLVAPVGGPSARHRPARADRASRRYHFVAHRPRALSRTWVGLLLTAAYLMVAGVLFSGRPFGCHRWRWEALCCRGSRSGRRSPVAAPTGLALGEHRTPSSSGRASSPVLLAYWPLAGLSIVERLTHTTTRLDRPGPLRDLRRRPRGRWVPLPPPGCRREIHPQRLLSTPIPRARTSCSRSSDVFLRGTDDPGIMIAEYNRYVLGVVIGFGCFIAAVVWAAADGSPAPAVTEPARVVLAAVVGRDPRCSGHSGPTSTRTSTRR